MIVVSQVVAVKEKSVGKAPRARVNSKGETAPSTAGTKVKKAKSKRPARNDEVSIIYCPHFAI